jgi:sulfoxide reductase heme-binding subunit YedZ
VGLYAFFYAVLHFLAFFAWDYGANLDYIWLDISDKRYILVGALALLILISLAITSTRWSMRKLGKRWKRLHQWVYPAAVLVVIHYIWSVKADLRLPIAAGAVLACMLLVRLPPLRRWLSQKQAALRSRIGSFPSSNPSTPEIK